MPYPAACRVLVLPVLAGSLLSSSIAIGQSFTLTLAPSQHNGYNISCYGGEDGAIDLTVTGGTAPYTYEWSNTLANIEDQTGLAAGYYQVSVTDANNDREVGEVTLTGPGQLEIHMEPYSYPNGFNVSCYNCFNGSIDVSVIGGVLPYSYLWQDGATTADRTAIGSGNYYFELTDANNCVASSEVIYLTEPERNDWTMNGNANTTPGTQYIGTSDNKDLVFKTNGSERWRFIANGDVQSSSLAFGSGYRPLFVDSTGTLRIGTGTDVMWPGRVNSDCCPTPTPWFLCGNSLCLDQFLGSNNAVPLKFKTNGVEQMRITVEGKVGIGMAPPTGSSSIYKLYVEGGITARDVKVTINTFNDYVFSPDYSLLPLDELRAYLHSYRHLPGIPSEAEIRSNEGVELGEFQMKMLRVAEEQALYILQLEARLGEVEQRLKELVAKQQ